jgi:hypothetical protein
MSRFSESQFKVVDEDFAKDKARRVAPYNRFLQLILDGEFVAFTLRGNGKSDRFSIPKFWNTEANRIGKKIESYLHADRKHVIFCLKDK